jgi:hypothetical protein
LRMSQTVVDLAAGDPTMGNGFGMGSPLAAALAWRGVARWWLDRPGWRKDHHDAIAMARTSDPTTLACVVAWTYGLEIQYGVLRADDSAVRASEEALQAAMGTSNDVALSMATYALGVTLLNRDTAADRDRGLALMMQAQDMWRDAVPFLVPVTEVWAAREQARRGDRDGAIATMRLAVDELHRAGPLAGYSVWGKFVLLQTLIERSASSDLDEAEKAIAQLADLGTDQPAATLEISLLRLRTMLVRARGDDAAYRELSSRYHAMAESLTFEGHIAWAEAMSG